MKRIEQAETSPSALAMYKEFAREFTASSKTLYPCAGIDVTPSQVFIDVTYLELNEARANILKKSRKHVLNLDIRSLPVSGYDLLIIQNPEIPTEWMTPHLLPNGLIIANNHHGNAKWLYERSKRSKEFDFIAGLEVICNPGNSFTAKLERDTSGYFQPVKDEKELNSLPEARKRTILEDIESALRIKGNEVPSGNFMQDLRRAQTLLKKDFSMPAKRTANSYIFRKN
ncbi:MAG: hypothetical protein Q7R87_01470 [Nanoarchaeota archaeon]|nr:hypothetical protein [Nanoarchaeota archaeon]